MVSKNPASDVKMKIYNESLSRGKKFILEKKEKANKKKRPKKKGHTNWKKIKRHANGWLKEKKPPLGLLSYNAKSALY